MCSQRCFYVYPIPTFPIKWVFCGILKLKIGFNEGKLFTFKYLILISRPKGSSSNLKLSLRFGCSQNEASVIKTYVHFRIIKKIFGHIYITYFSLYELCLSFYISASLREPHLNDFFILFFRLR